MSTQQRTARGAGGLLGGKEREIRGKVEGTEGGKANIQGFQTPFPPEISDTHRGKSDISLPFLSPQGHRAAKHLINVVVFLWSQESLICSFLLRKIKNRRPTVQRTPENTAGSSQHALNGTRSSAGRPALPAPHRPGQTHASQGNKHRLSLTSPEIPHPGQRRGYFCNGLGLLS